MVARIGYTARGIVFLIVAGLAARTVVFQTDEVGGTRGALESFLPGPLGRTLLAAVAIGLAGYVVWRFVQAVTLPFTEAEGWKTLPRRAAFGFSGAFYSLLALTAGELALGMPTHDADAEQKWSAWLLEVPLGEPILAGIGITIAAGGLHTVYRGLWRRFNTIYDQERLVGARKMVAQIAGVAGLTTMGLVLIAVGGYIIQAALRSNASRIMDLHGILVTVALGAYGRILLGIAAAGLAAYAVHCLLLGAFRKIRA